ncbi:MAG: dehydrogenase [Hyphomicrobiales bacterium]|nr:dehydrogenase [Hyphomicrobiales bacterium]
MTVETKNTRKLGAGASRALWYTSKARAELRPVAVPEPGPGEALILTLWSGISRGTERLVYEGRVPMSEYDRMKAPFQEGEFPYPVKYGYCAVGIVEQGPKEWLGIPVFALHPHQTRFVMPVERLVAIPEALPLRRAALAANMETALNALWDSGAGPGDRIVIVGAGLIGLLVAFLAARLPGAEVTVVDVEPDRAGIVAALGATFRMPNTLAGDADVVFHASAQAEGLATALGAAGMEATVVELSWYGDKQVMVPLGGAFHSRRLKLVSSQVGQVATGRRPRWTYARRLRKALDLLQDDVIDQLITGEVAFESLPDALHDILSPTAPALATVVRY